MCENESLNVTAQNLKGLLCRWCQPIGQRSSMKLTSSAYLNVPSSPSPTYVCLSQFSITFFFPHKIHAETTPLINRS
jgi:hypothetical protein